MSVGLSLEEHNRARAGVEGDYPTVMREEQLQQKIREMQGANVASEKNIIVVAEIDISGGEGNGWTIPDELS